MNQQADEGLGVSVLVYVAALLCGLSLIMVPVYYASGPTVLANPDTDAVNSILAARRKNNVGIPLAVLRHDDIVSPADLAAFNAKGKVKPERTARVAPRTHEETNSFADAGYERRAHTGFFPFSLF